MLGKMYKKKRADFARLNLMSYCIESHTYPSQRIPLFSHNTQLDKIKLCLISLYSPNGSFAKRSGC